MKFITSIGRQSEGSAIFAEPRGVGRHPSCFGISRRAASFLRSIAIAVGAAAAVGCGGGGGGGTGGTTVATATGGLISAARIPATGYSTADGKLTPNFNHISDVWAASGIVAAAGGGLGVSEDQGATWTGVPSSDDNSKIAIGPDVILEAGRYVDDSRSLVRHIRSGRGVWSTEALDGLTFIDPTLGAPYRVNISSLVYFGSSFYALMYDMNAQLEGSVYKSADGTKWTKQSYRFHVDCDLRAMEKAADGRIIACGKMSKDNGGTWAYLPLPFNSGVAREAFANLIVADTDVAIGNGQSSPRVEIYWSTDQGASYAAVAHNLGSIIGNAFIASVAVVGSDIVAVSRDASNPASGLVTRILRSSDKGKTWTASETGFVHATSVAYTAAPARMASLGSQLYFAVQEPGGGGASVLYQSNDGGRNWAVALKTEVSFTDELWSEGGQCYRTDMKWVLSGADPAAEYTSRRSTDGINWTTIGVGQFARVLDSKGTRLRRVEPAFVMNGVLKEGISSIEKFDDKTGKWRTVLTSSVPTMITYPTAADGAIYVGFRSISQLFKSVDAGETWQQVANTSMPPYVAKIQALGNRTLLAVNGPPACVGPCAVLPGYVQGVFISRDEGATWTAVPDFQLPANTIFGDVGGGTVLGSRIGLPGLVRYESPYVGTTLVDPLAGAAADFLMFEEGTFMTSTRDGMLGISNDGGMSWQTARLDVKGPVTGFGVCGGRLLLNKDYSGIVYSPKL